MAEVNDALADTPELINEDPYEAWIIKVRTADITAYEELLDFQAYQAVCENE